jgi:hypothetical protein
MSVFDSVNRWLLSLAIVLMIVSTIFHIVAYRDRQEIKREALMQRKMLNARAVNQEIYFYALRRKGLLTDAEVNQILSNWKDAEYVQEVK